MNNLSFSHCQDTLEILFKSVRAVDRGKKVMMEIPHPGEKQRGDQQEEDRLQDAWEVSKGHFLIWKTEQYYQFGIFLENYREKEQNGSRHTLIISTRCNFVSDLLFGTLLGNF